MGGARKLFVTQVGGAGGVFVVAQVLRADMWAWQVKRVMDGEESWAGHFATQTRICGPWCELRWTTLV